MSDRSLTTYSFKISDTLLCGKYKEVSIYVSKDMVSGCFDDDEAIVADSLPEVIMALREKCSDVPAELAVWRKVTIFGMDFEG